MFERVIQQTAWKRTRVFLISENEAIVVIEARPEGFQEWTQVLGFVISRDVAYAAHDLFKEFK